MRIQIFSFVSSVNFENRIAQMSRLDVQPVGKPCGRKLIVPRADNLAGHSADNFPAKAIRLHGSKGNWRVVWRAHYVWKPSISSEEKKFVRGLPIRLRPTNRDATTDNKRGLACIEFFPGRSVKVNGAVWMHRHRTTVLCSQGENSGLAGRRLHGAKGPARWCAHDAPPFAMVAVSRASQWERSDVSFFCASTSVCANSNATSRQ